jgi:hypothetical protein
MADRDIGVAEPGVATEQVRSSVVKTDNGLIERVLLREDLRALQNRKGPVKITAMSERVTANRHRV